MDLIKLNIKYQKKFRHPHRLPRKVKKACKYLIKKEMDCWDILGKIIFTTNDWRVTAYNNNGTPWMYAYGAMTNKYKLIRKVNFLSIIMNKVWN